MNLQTTIPLVKQLHNQIDYTSSVMLIGSCFSENIGDKFEYFKFKNTVNPFGILFQPLAIEKLILNAINEKEYTEDDIFFNNEQWHCFDAHSKLSAASKEELLKRLNESIKSTAQQISKATHIVITLGTSWVYRNIENDSIVANCHKVPQKRFLKEILPVDAIRESLESSVSLIKSVNPDCTVLFTVSPVRHLKDGHLENAQSKAHLLSALHQIIEPRKKLFYFPSYEIMMDELRDYRFYAQDMIHPSTIAVDYIWQKFYSTWFTESAILLMDEVDAIQKAIAHKPFNPNSEAHKKFLENLDKKIKALQDKLPHIQL